MRRFRLLRLVGSAAALACALLGVQATAASADATITPENADFGSRLIGTTSTSQSFTLTVTCHVAMMCAPDPFQVGISSEGSVNDFAVTHNCPGAMPGTSMAGTSCTINVSFTPTAVGLRGIVVHSGEELNPPEPEPHPGPVAQMNGVGLKPLSATPILTSTAPGAGSTATGKKKKCKKKRGRVASAAKKKKCKKRRK